MKRLLLTMHWLNLDTAVGAVITSGFIAHSMEVEVPILAYVTLFLAVLGIYNFDHLVDARSISSQAISMRHRFYQDNLKSLSIYQLALFLLLIVIVWYLPDSILRAGFILGLITGMYFILLFLVFPKKFMLKEIMIGVVYATALFLAPFYSKSTGDLSSGDVLLWIEIILLAISNTLVFAWYDYQMDSKENHTSLAISLGRINILRLIIIVLSSLFIVICLSLIFYTNFEVQFVILLMGSALLYSILGHKQLEKADRYRIIGDAIFILPAVAYII